MADCQNTGHTQVIETRLHLVGVQGKLMWPPPPPKVEPGAPPAAAAAAAPVVKEPPPPPNYFNITLKDSLMYTAGLGSALGMSFLVRLTHTCHRVCTGCGKADKVLNLR